VIALDRASAPGTVANFEKLLHRHFYNGLRVHRVIPDYLVQTGDPLSRGRDKLAIGTGGPGYTLAPEIKQQTRAGLVAMARLPDKINPTRRSNGSQFFFALKGFSEGHYTVFGRIVEGLEVIEQISHADADPNDNPVEPIVIKSARLMGSP
jgi:cyclophilin family peptidyl-prolyl cis-trans isomerase